MPASRRRSLFYRGAATRLSTARRRARPLSRPLALEVLEDRSLMAGLPFGAAPNDTGEYMLGEVYVNVVLMESNGLGSENTENWTAPQIAAVKANITQGLQWWEDTLALAQGAHPNPNLLNFTLDFTRADNPVSTSLEPIGHPSYDVQQWVVDFFNSASVKPILDSAGLSPNGSFSDNIRAFNNAQRLAHNADWSYTIFVVNDANDADHQFQLKPGGFPLAFSFPGGQAVVSLASRPASTYSHETGIIFWARDEYTGGGNYTDHRGYYDTQNENAIDGNPNPASVVPSIMADHAAAFPNTQLTGPDGRLAQSTMEEIGWKDSDGDGIFDVLDVPHSLSGSGYYDSASQSYRFFGSSAVRTLPNLNPVNSPAVPYGGSLQDDITINRLSRVEFRVNGAGNAWQTAATFPDRPTNTSLSLSIPLSENFQSIEIRTVDDRTGVTSDVFTGTPDGIAAVPLPGINGFVRNDVNADGLLSPGELGLPGWTVRLVDDDLQPIVLQQLIEPDSIASGTDLNSASGIAGVTLRAVGNASSSAVIVGNGDTNVATGNPIASTGSRVFQRRTSGPTSNLTSSWTASVQLRIDFTSPQSTVSLDAVANTTGDVGRLDAYDSANQLVARYTTKGLTLGQAETMTVSAAPGSIAYVIAKGHLGTGVELDNLRIGPKSSTITDARGAYSLAYLPGGSYTVQVLAANNADITTSATQSLAIGGAAFVSGIDFGGHFDAGQFPFQNPAKRFDVNGDGAVDSRDAFALVAAMRAQAIPSGGLPLPSAAPLNAPPPYVDVQPDNVLDVRDVFALIAALRASDSGSSGSGGGGGGSGGEGEAPAIQAARTATVKADIQSSSQYETSAASGQAVAALWATLASGRPGAGTSLSATQERVAAYSADPVQPVSPPAASLSGGSLSLTPSVLYDVASHVARAATSKITLESHLPASDERTPVIRYISRSATASPDPQAVAAVFAALDRAERRTST